MNPTLPASRTVPVPLPAAGTSPASPRAVAVLVDDGVDGLGVARLLAELQRAGASFTLVSPTATPIATQLGGMLDPDAAVDAVSPAAFDAVLVPGGAHCAERLLHDAPTLGFVRHAWLLGRTVAAVGAGVQLLAAIGLPHDGVVDAVDEPLPGVLVGHGGHSTLANFGCRLGKLLEQAPHTRGEVPLAA